MITQVRCLINRWLLLLRNTFCDWHIADGIIKLYKRICENPATVELSKGVNQVYHTTIGTGPLCYSCSVTNRCTNPLKELTNTWDKARIDFKWE